MNKNTFNRIFLAWFLLANSIAIVIALSMRDPVPACIAIVVDTVLIVREVQDHP